MIYCTAQLVDKLKNYSNPLAKISRMIKKGELYSLTRGLYIDDKNISGMYIAGALYGPSYLSFNTALAYHGMIPEAVYSFTSATCDKLKKKSYKNVLGTFYYRDVPRDAFPYGVEVVESGEYSFLMATKEKALCDKLYELPVVKNTKELEKMLFEDLRIESSCFETVVKEDIYFLSSKYRSTNVYMLEKYLRRLKQ